MSASTDDSTQPDAPSSSEEVGSPPVQRRLQALLLFVVILIAGITLVLTKNYYHYLTMSEPERITFLWKRDFNTLSERQLLPPEMQDLKSFRFITTSPLTKQWHPEIQVPFTTKKGGKHQMEILLMALEEEDIRGAVIQMNISTIKGDNHVWELGRTYSLRLQPLEQKLVQNLKFLQ